MNEFTSMIWRALDELRGDVQADKAVDVLLYDAAIRCGLPEGSSDRAHRDWSRLKGTKTYTALSEASMRLLSASPQERLEAIDFLISRAARANRTEVWVSYLPAKRIAELVGDADHVRCAFDAALHPALVLAVQGKKVHFISQSYTTCELATMISTILEAPIQVVTANPFSRIDEGAFEAEIIMSPFGLRITSGSDIPIDTLSILGEGEKPRRLFSDPLAVADALVTSTPRVVVSVADGMMFRSVGVEPIAREMLIESGHLKAVMAIPGGMVFPHTGIASDLLILDKGDLETESVRFVNLADDHFATKTVRGRPEVRAETAWAEATLMPLSKADRFAANIAISDIREKDYILSLERYILPPAVMAVEAFLSDKKTRALQELVEMIRPLSLGKDEGGEFMIREAAPSDKGPEDFLLEPKKETFIERAQLRKARNQRLLPGDVVLSVKGTIGSVAIVPNEAPTDGESDFWTAGQSFMVLRPKKNGISGLALYEYLSNEAVREALKSLAGGAAIQTIAIKDLKELQIPIPSEQEQIRMEEAFQVRQKLFTQMRAISDDIKSQQAATWPHNELRIEQGSDYGTGQKLS